MSLRVTTFCLCLVFAHGLATSSSAQTEADSPAWQGTVNLDSVSLYSGLSVSSRVVTQLNRGDSVIINMEITGSGGKWYAVTTAGEPPTSGYLSEKALDIQKPVAIIDWEYKPPPEVTAVPGPSAPEAVTDIVAAFKGTMGGDLKGFFVSKFGRTLPVSAFGQTRLHTRLGFDHRRSVDVALSPDSAEGQALLKKLRGLGVPFIAFRKAIPGIATGAHIHIGKPSPRRR